MTDPQSLADQQDASEFETASVVAVQPPDASDKVESDADKSDSDEFEHTN